MIALAAIFTPVFTLGLGAVPPHLYSHGSSMLGTLQQVAAAFGTALVVTVMTARARALTGDGVAPVEALLEGMRTRVLGRRRAVAADGRPGRAAARSAERRAGFRRLSATAAHRPAPSGAGCARCARSACSWASSELSSVSVTATIEVTIRTESVRRSSGDQASVPGKPGEVGGQLALDELDLTTDLLAHPRRTRHPLAGDEAEVLALRRGRARRGCPPTGRRCRRRWGRRGARRAASRAARRRTRRPGPGPAPRSSRSGGRTRWARCRPAWRPGAAREPPGCCPRRGRGPRRGWRAGCAPCARRGSRSCPHPSQCTCVH